MVHVRGGDGVDALSTEHGHDVAAEECFVVGVQLFLFWISSVAEPLSIKSALAEIALVEHRGSLGFEELKLKTRAALSLLPTQDYSG
jgi:hypothetical protein